jgi:hypothetical protein
LTDGELIVMAASTFAKLWARLGTGWRVGLLVLGAVLLASAACWWLTEPLDRGETTVGPVRPAAAPVAVESPRPEFPDWPPGRTEGDAAKHLLLETLLTVRDRLGKVAGYTATFRKQERVGGALGPEQTMVMKLRHDPFAVYLKYVAPSAGKEVVYARGHRDNKVIVHSVGIARLLVPRLAVHPDHPLALAENRHAITDVGLANLTEKLIGFRRLDIDDPDAVTILDRTTDGKGRPRLRSIHAHPRPDDKRPFARVEVLYDPDLRLPVQIASYDWPTEDPPGELLLAERYAYDDVDFSAALSDLDFDPSNPAYAFQRY